LQVQALIIYTGFERFPTKFTFLTLLILVCACGPGITAPPFPVNSVGSSGQQFASRLQIKAEENGVVRLEMSMDANTPLLERNGRFRPATGSQVRVTAQYGTAQPVVTAFTTIAEGINPYTISYVVLNEVLQVTCVTPNNQTCSPTP
jgi:hypothetical protein